MIPDQHATYVAYLSWLSSLLTRESILIFITFILHPQVSVAVKWHFRGLRQIVLFMGTTLNPPASHDTASSNVTKPPFPHI